MPALSRLCFLPVAALALGLTSLPVFAQTEGVRLQRRGVVGDVYKYQRADHIKGELNLSLKSDSILLDATKKHVFTERFAGAGKEGNVRIEIRILSGQEDGVEDGKEIHKPLPRAAALFIATPDLKTWTVKPLTAPDKKDKSTARARAEAQAAAEAVLRDTTDLFLRVEMPSRLLRVGDEWQGAMPKNPYNKEEKDAPDVAYNAKLIAIEPHQGVPCAKIVYTVASKADSPSFRAAILKDLPEETKMTGTVELSGTITDFVALDRGARIESLTKLKIQMNYKLLLRIGETKYMKEEHLEGAYDEEKTTTATQFPPYAAGMAVKGK